MLVAVLCHGGHPLRCGVWFAAVALGGICGILGAYCKGAFADNLPLIGMALSFIVSMASVRWRTKGTRD